MHSRFLDAVKTFEGFAAKSSWDYAQHTNGFGTKALYPGERISLEEANQRFLAEINEARQFVEKQAQGWDEGTKAALTSLTFNAGTRWASGGLGEAVRNFDIDGVRSRFLEYTKAGGEVLPGLVKRRLAEVTWIGEGVAAPPPGSQATKHDARNPTTTVPAPPGVTDLVAAIAPSEARPPTSPAHSTSSENQMPVASDVAAAQRAASVAWMLLTLDLASLTGASPEDRERGGPTVA